MRTNKRRILHLPLILLGMIIIGIAVQHTDVCAGEETSVVEQAKQNVFAIDVSISCDGKADPRLIRSETCFMIGNAARDQKQYMITAKTNLDVSDKQIKKYRKDNKLEENDAVQTVYEIVISDDIRRVASVYDRAQDSNYAILQLDETIQDRSGIPFGNLEQTKDQAAIFLLTYDRDTYQVGLESTHLSQMDEKSIYYQASATEGYGAPVIDESGNLLGMRIPPEADQTELAEGLRVDCLQNAFDTLGLAYESSDSKITVLEAKIADAQAAVDSGDYTKRTVQVLDDAIEKAQEVYDDMKSTDADYQQQVDDLDTAMQQLKPMEEIYRLIMIICGIVLVVVLLIVLIVCLNIRKKKRALHYRTEAPHKQPKSAAKRKKNEAPVDYDATVAMSAKMPTAYLIHKNTDERILIGKTHFLVGSKADRVDYCIMGNPSVSRIHAEVINENGIFFLQDKGSMNHSYVNDKKLESGEKMVLRNQDVIRLANEEFLFEMK